MKYTIKGLVQGQMVWKFTFNENGEIVEQKAISKGTWNRVKRDAQKDPNVHAFDILVDPRN